MPQVAPEVRRERAARLRAAVAASRAAWLSELVGTTQEVLVEAPGTRGHAGNFAEVRFPSPQTPGSIRRVAIDAATDTHLIGTPL
jgi:threonylcarbamoyladenosine tRNA methylthiotransferase MtaB